MSSSYAIMLVVLFVIVFGTFFFVLVNARSVARAARQDADADNIAPGPGPRGASRSAIWVALGVHFAAWAGIFTIWMWMTAETEATQPFGEEIAKEVAGPDQADQITTNPNAAPTTPQPTERPMGPATPVTTAPPEQAGTSDPAAPPPPAAK